jgi:hypothetical protein
MSRLAISKPTMIKPLIAALALFGLAFAGMPLDSVRAQDDMFDESEMDDAEADAFFEEFMGSVRRDEADRERCANTRDTVSKEEQYDACTRLIEDAPNENDLVGSYYVNRALAPKGPASQCLDVTRGVAIIEGSKSTVFSGAFLNAAKSLKESACR